MSQDLFGIIDEDEAQPPAELLRHLLEIPFVPARQDHGADPCPMRPQDLLLDPPIGSTLPRSVISPVMAASLRTGRRVTANRDSL